MFKLFKYNKLLIPLILCCITKYIAVGLTGIEKCNQLQWNEGTVTKGTGSVVNVMGTTNAESMRFTWFEAASCCRTKKKTIASIANAKDLSGYHDRVLALGDEAFYSLGWANGYAFEDGKLRNLNGEYIDHGNKEIYSPMIDPPQKGKCTGMFEESSERSKYYLLFTVDCSYSWPEKFFCEDPDPNQPAFNIDCFNLGPKTDWWTQEDWELVLDKGRNCGEKKGPEDPGPSPGKSQNISGNFIPESTFRPIRGMMEPGATASFTPNRPSDEIKSTERGTFLPLETNDFEFPFMTLYGVMEPHAEIRGSSAFTVDDTIPGTFIADEGLITFTGRMAQDNPALFTPDKPPYIQEPTEGNWIPASGILPNHPCNTIHGKMQPKPSSATTSIFTADPSRHGTFTADNDPQNPVQGSLSQAILPKFTPDTQSFEFDKPTSGTWKPNPLDNSASISHGIMKPIPNEGAVFVPESVIFGIFYSDQDPTNPIDGSMTRTVPQIFSPYDTLDMSNPIPGKWKPYSGPETQGTLKQTDYLPPNYILFEPGGK